MIKNKLCNNILFEDILFNILKYINHETLTFILKNTDKYGLMCQIYFEELIDYDQIKELSYSDNFKNIKLDHMMDVFL